MPDDPIPEDLVGVMNEIARILDGAIKGEAGRSMGFMLMVFDFGGGGRMSYISNAVREDMIKALHEFIARQGDGDSG